MVGLIIFQKQMALQMEKLGDRVAMARNDLGWDQDQLSREVKKLNPKLRTSKSTISSIETGKSEKPTILYEIAAALGVTEHWLKTGLPPKRAGAGNLTERSTQDALEAAFAGFLGVLQAFGFDPDDAEILAEIARVAAEEPLTGEPPEEYARARRILAASATRKFLTLKGIKPFRA